MFYCVRFLLLAYLHVSALNVIDRVHSNNNNHYVTQHTDNSIVDMVMQEVYVTSDTVR